MRLSRTARAGREPVQRVPFFHLPILISWLMLINAAAAMQDLDASRRVVKDNHLVDFDKEARKSSNLEMKIDNQPEDELYIGYSDPWVSPSGNYPAIPPTDSLNDTQISIKEILKARSTQGKSHSRWKRGVIHLYNMIICATGCDPLAYKGYGCYCGFLGSGIVMDGIDKCCMMHDLCYNAAECPMMMEYVQPYYWKCYRGYKPVCAVEHGKWGGSGSCAQRLCECDRSFSECLRRYPCPRNKAMCTSSPWRLVQNLFMVF